MFTRAEAASTREMWFSKARLADRQIADTNKVLALNLPECLLRCDDFLLLIFAAVMILLIV